MSRAVYTLSVRGVRPHVAVTVSAIAEDLERAWRRARVLLGNPYVDGLSYEIVSIHDLP